MNKEFIPYEQALKLKELGFDERRFGYYVGSELITSINDIFNSTDILIIPAPLYQQAFRWFREKHNVRFYIQSSMSDLGEYFKLIFPDGEQRGIAYDTYEEAELECLKKLIEIVKDKKQIQKTNNSGTMGIYGKPITDYPSGTMGNNWNPNI